jgi:hypothetical protein
VGDVGTGGRDLGSVRAARLPGQDRVVPRARRNGRIVYVYEHADRDEALEAAGLRE